MKTAHEAIAAIRAGLDEAADEYVQTLADRADENLRIDTTLETAFKAGAKWRESQIPVPNDMRDAADEYSATPENKKPVDGEKYKAFVAGAEWMAEQGVSVNGMFGIRGVESDNIVDAMLDGGLKMGDKVIVQIRKK